VTVSLPAAGRHAVQGFGLAMTMNNTFVLDRQSQFAVEDADDDASKAENGGHE
jgi:hypothetical protein